MSNRLSDAIYMTKRVVARHPNVDLAAPYPRKLAFDGGEHMVIVKLGVQTGRHVALDRPYIMLKPTLATKEWRRALSASGERTGRRSWELCAPFKRQESLGRRVATALVAETYW